MPRWFLSLLIVMLTLSSVTMHAPAWSKGATPAMSCHDAPSEHEAPRDAHKAKAACVGCIAPLPSLVLSSTPPLLVVGSPDAVIISQITGRGDTPEPPPPKHYV